MKKSRAFTIFAAGMLAFIAMLVSLEDEVPVVYQIATHECSDKLIRFPDGLPDPDEFVMNMMCTNPDSKATLEHVESSVVRFVKCSCPPRKKENR